MQDLQLVIPNDLKVQIENGNEGAIANEIGTKLLKSNQITLLQT